MKLLVTPLYAGACLCLISLPRHSVNTFTTLPCHDTMIIEEDLSFKDAEARCKTYNYSGLAVLHNDEALKSFLDTIKDHASSSDDYWVGLTSRDTSHEWEYRWSNGYYYPDISSVSSGCGKADSMGNKDIVNCNQCRKSVCADYFDYRNIFYFLEDEIFTQSEAEARCKDIGFHRLAVLNSQEKLEYALGEKSSEIVYWIGMTASFNNELKWTSGEDVTWAQWHPESEPDFLDSQKCVRLSENGFATKPCEIKMSAVCENTTAPECPVHIPANIKPPRLRHFAPKIQEVQGVFPKNKSIIISTKQARSLMDCSLICAQTDGCKSVAYHEESKRCSSLLSWFSPAVWSSLLEIVEGWKVVNKCA